MEEEKVSQNHLTSAAAFVEGGIQDACDDACSICLEPFCDSDPSALTTCKHEFHLQCVLEWCQRSSHCPMCWQAISLKDPSCQELLEAVEHERNLRMNPPRSTTIFHHPTLGDFELQHFPVNASEFELEERIIQHLAAAAAMGRARQLATREGRSRPSSQGRPHYLVLSTLANNGASGTYPTPPTGPNTAQTTNGEVFSVQADQIIGAAASTGASQLGNQSNNRGNQDRAGPSDFQSFSESLKTRFTALSTRYKETISKSTRSWKERLFARMNSPEPTPNSQTTAATVSRMMDHLQISNDNANNLTTSTEQETTTAYPAETHTTPSVLSDEESRTVIATASTTAAASE